CENDIEMIIKGSRWRCQRRICRKEKGMRTNNWLSGSRLPIHIIVYCWAYEMIYVSYCKREFGMSKSVVVDWNNYLREVCVWKIEIGNKEIGGPNLILEIYESLFVRRKNNAGRILPQQWVLGGICRETKECFIVCVPDRSVKTLLPLIQKFIRPGSIFSDSWRSSYPKRGKNVGCCKWGNKRSRGTARNFLDSYMAEFMWRSKLTNQNDPFEQI
ncbi:DDE Tnp IS1595 domain-containing protein, partial [Aphis craccivora]